MTHHLRGGAVIAAGIRLGSEGRFEIGPRLAYGAWPYSTCYLDERSDPGTNTRTTRPATAADGRDAVVIATGQATYFFLHAGVRGEERGAARHRSHFLPSRAACAPRLPRHFTRNTPRSSSVREIGTPIFEEIARNW